MHGRQRPDDPAGNRYVDRIRRLIRAIPRGTVSSYGRIAAAAGNPRGARAVVWILRGTDNLPWHRVVAADGGISLPDEAGDRQRARLEAENVGFDGNGRVDLRAHLVDLDRLLADLDGELDPW